MSVHASGGGRSDSYDMGGVLIGVGALVTVIGAVLPWLTVAGNFGDAGTVSGFDMISDAVLPIFSPILTIGLAVVAVLITVGLQDSDLARFGEIAAGVVIALVAVIFIVSPETVFGGGLEGELVGAFTDPGIGILATLGAGIAIAVGGVVNLTG